MESANRSAKIEGQRLRLLEGLAASIREKGLSQTQVADIVRHAHASRRTFYNHFHDKEACLVEFVRLSGAGIADAVALAVDTDAPVTTRVDQAIESYLTVLGAEPRLAVELSSPSAGARVVQAQREAMEQFAEFVVSLTGARPGDRAARAGLSSECAYLLVSGLRATVHRAIERGEDIAGAGAAGKTLFKAALGAPASPLDSDLNPARTTRGRRPPVG